MKAIICLDENKGMLFNQRRQSSDKILVEKVLEFTQNNLIYMSQFSAKLFTDAENIMVCDDFVNEAEENSFCFIEDKLENISLFDEFYCFNWNKVYPADVYFPYDLEQEGFSLISTEDFKGNSHDKITLSIFRRNTK